MRSQTVTTRQELIDLHNSIWDIVVWTNAPTFVAVEGSLISYSEVRQQIGQFRYLQLSDAILFNELLPPGLLLGRNLVVTRFSNNLLADMAY